MSIAAEEAAHLSHDWLWTFPLFPDTSQETQETRIRWIGQIVNREAAAAADQDPRGATSALVTTMYQRFGCEMIPLLRGRFAVAIVDMRARRTMVARDHAGLQPVFYACHGNAVSFSSSPEQLVRLPGVSRTLNRVVLADTLCHRHPDPAATCFADVSRLPAGCAAIIQASRLRVQRYWAPCDQPRLDAECPDWSFSEFERLHDAAIARCLVPARTGIYLSGGIDSASVALGAAAIAAREESSPPAALCLSFADAACDERDVQTEVARALGLPHHELGFELAIGARPLVEQSVALNRHLSSPLLGFWTPAYLELARLGRTHNLTTALTGIGGDEWFSASGYTTADLISRGDIAGARRFIQTWRRSESAHLLWHCGLRPLAGMLMATLAPNSWDRSRARRFTAHDPAWIAPDPALRKAQQARASGALGPARPYNGFAAAHSAQSLTHSLSQQQLEEYFELSLLTGVELRHPYYDVDLVSFLCRAPLTLLNLGGWLKGLPRRQLAMRFPHLGFDRQKKALADSFYRRTLAREWRALAAQKLLFPTLSELGIVDAAKAHDMAQAQIQDQAPGGQLWDLINLEAWACAHA